MSQMGGIIQLSKQHVNSNDMDSRALSKEEGGNAIRLSFDSLSLFMTRHSRVGAKCM
jgi:hypothetical protein